MYGVSFLLRGSGAIGHYPHPEIHFSPNPFKMYKHFIISRRTEVKHKFDIICSTNFVVLMKPEKCATLKSPIQSGKNTMLPLKPPTSKFKVFFYLR